MTRFVGTRSPAGYFVPLLKVELQIAGETRFVDAMVDSGAEISAVPAEIVESFGVDFDRLPIIGDGAGVGGAFEIRRLDGRLTFGGQLIREPLLVFAHAQLPEVLLGTSDFFAKFVVRFLWHRDPPVFDVDPA